MHVSKGFGPDTAPIRSRYGPDTAPIWPRYGPDTAPIRPHHGPDTSPIRPPKCIFPKIQPPKAGIFWKNRNYKELIGAIRGEEFWIELSWFVLLLRTLGDGKMGGFVWKWKSAKPNILKIFFLRPCRHAFGKKAAWKQRRWFWGRSSNVSICVCAACPSNNLKPLAVLFCGCVFGEFAKRKHARKAHVNSCRHACAIHNVNSYRLGYAPASKTEHITSKDTFAQPTRKHDHLGDLANSTYKHLATWSLGLLLTGLSLN